MERRKELAAFIRTRRARLTPDDVGLPLTSRRRTPGLRREEVAQLAAVGSTWYTWLEQGRNISVSPQVLRGVSRALQLSPTEQQHLFTLAHLPMPENLEAPAETLDSKLQEIVDNLGNLPALVINQRWDILAWNQNMENLCGNIANKTQPNVLRNFFTDSESQRRLINWEAQAKSAIGVFRSLTSKFVDTDWYRELVADLTAASPEFRQWWPQQTICQALNIPKHYAHPDPRIGRIHLLSTLFTLEGQPNLRLVINTPADSHSRQKLAVLFDSALAP